MGVYRVSILILYLPVSFPAVGKPERRAYFPSQKRKGHIYKTKMGHLIFALSDDLNPEHMVASISEDKREKINK